MQANPDKPWDLDWLSYNPNITWEIVETNPDKNGVGMDYQIIQILHGKLYKQMIKIGIGILYQNIQILHGKLYKQIRINLGIGI